jgi:histidyl-tRNA synthetase
MSTLTGKYGEEGERLLFRVLNNGDFLGNADREALQNADSNALAASIAKRGMRYDLTVPFARFVVMHQNDLQFPFKRYQIQPVWRADRPQKGRYQEFYQCDVDVVGSTSLVYEAELVQIYDEVFNTLGLDVTIRINHRKILAGIAEHCNVAEHLTAMTTSIDKWDKIGEDGVGIEMQKRRIPQTAINKITEILKKGSLESLSGTLNESSAGMQGIIAMKEVMQYLNAGQLHNTFRFDVRLARGLDYYTGCIFEVDANDADMGSLGGGGRYDDLTSIFGMPGTSGVGISFGAERIFDVMESKKLFPSSLSSAPQILCIPLDKETMTFAFEVTTSLRNQGISADLYPEPAKLQKQLKYANQLGVRYVAIIGEDELSSRSVMLRNMDSGDQEIVAAGQLTSLLSGKLSG